MNYFKGNLYFMWFWSFDFWGNSKISSDQIPLGMTFPLYYDTKYKSLITKCFLHSFLMSHPPPSVTNECKPFSIIIHAGTSCCSPPPPGTGTRAWEGTPRVNKSIKRCRKKLWVQRNLSLPPAYPCWWGAALRKDEESWPHVGFFIETWLFLPKYKKQDHNRQQGICVRSVGERSGWLALAGLAYAHTGRDGSQDVFRFFLDRG